MLDEFAKFVPGHSLIDRTPIVGQAIRMGKLARTLYNSTNPYEAVPRAIAEVIIDCTPPNVKYPLKCLILVGQVCLLATTGPNPYSLSLMIGATNQILEGKL